ncbi:dihydroneopterin aldolase [Opitutus sp. GAS368]|jgi:dihydroneopterin aldolase|uniref:dihydroneopterin aldolase n=1 Tax=Opitutus sp. GAS368 TaxID=1882749 RepID=UPI00087D13EE|nr:dihydroneopterin aldolase [Opitutus sp. GAS368]SDR76892.1 dihydroneopterin aldolase [Opitutus sp. GAS368]
MKPADKLVLTDMTFRACHGVLPVERRRRQEFRVTVELEVSVARAGRSDSLADTIDYCAVQAVVREVVEGAHRKLIEALAEDIARRLLAAFPAAQAVVIELLKPSPPVDFEFGGVQVRIRRARGKSRR